jgi:hypothetical protein
VTLRHDRKAAIGMITKSFKMQKKGILRYSIPLFYRTGI